MWEKRKDRTARLFYLFFILRRIVFIFMCFELQEEPVIYEILIVMFLNMAMLIYQGYFQPAYNLFENRIELFNEFNVSVCSTIVLCFTEWIHSEDLKFLIGWCFCCLILFQILINIIIIFYYSMRSSSLVARLSFNYTLVRCYRKIFKPK